MITITVKNKSKTFQRTTTISPAARSLQTTRLLREWIREWRASQLPRKPFAGLCRLAIQAVARRDLVLPHQQRPARQPNARFETIGPRCTR